MRDRYARVLGDRRGALVDGPVYLLGLYCAISPWVVHFTGSQPTLASMNLVMGIALALLGIGFTLAPARMSGLSGAICAMGVWLIIAPWIVGTSPDRGVIINNVIVGGLTVLLGMACMATAVRSGHRAT
jgi:hypothetical protein